MEVLINNRQKKIRLNTRRVRLIAEEIMRFEGLPENTELSLVFCDDDFIQKLNYQHLGKNEPTDVLSFPLDNNDFDHGERLLGDIVISVETAYRQAQELRHSVGLEIVFLLIHGLLHLNHYDHHRREDLKRMREREMTIFAHLNEKKMLKEPLLIMRSPNQTNSSTQENQKKTQKLSQEQTANERSKRPVSLLSRNRKISRTEN